MAGRRLKVRFVYRRGARYLGSTILRAEQLCRLAERHLGDRYDFATLAIPQPRFPGEQALWVKLRREAVFIFVKDAIDRLDREHLAALRRKSLGICVDYVDRSLALLRTDSVDLHIASSIAGEAALKALVAKDTDAGKPAGAATALLLHNTDARLEALTFRPPDRTHIVYFGGPGNVVFTAYARSVVDHVSAEFTRDMKTNFQRLADYNAHYCVRPEAPTERLDRVFVPFTKGFTAAVCQANVIVNRAVDDAVAFLGDQYPFLIDHSSERDIDEGLRHLIDAYGTTEWNEARAVMNAIRDRVAPAALARDLDAILRRLTG